MENYSQPGEALTLTAPSGGVVSGQPYKIGGLVVIATETKAQTLPFAAVTKGVVLGDKVAIQAWTEAQKIYWDNSARLFTTSAGGNTLVGVAAKAIAAAVGLATNATDGTPDAISIVDNVLTVNDYTAVEGKTVTVTIARDDAAPLVYVLTEGVDFDAATDNATTASRIAAAITALPRVTAVASQVAGSPATEVVTVTSNNPVHGPVRLDGAVR
jgi:predicted RecA/RadA family phage recombinase